MDDYCLRLQLTCRRSLVLCLPGLEHVKQGVSTLSNSRITASVVLLLTSNQNPTRGFFLPAHSPTIMSSKATMTDDALDSVVQLRKEMFTLVNERWENDLTEDDRNVITNFNHSLRDYSRVARVVGFGLGILVAHSSRSRRTTILQALRAHQRPLHVVFSSGQTGKDGSKPSFLEYPQPVR